MDNRSVLNEADWRLIERAQSRASLSEWFLKYHRKPVLVVFTLLVAFGAAWFVVTGSIHVAVGIIFGWGITTLAGFFEFVFRKCFVPRDVLDVVDKLIDSDPELLDQKLRRASKT